jgi:hypothetical protein
MEIQQNQFIFSLNVKVTESQTMHAYDNKSEGAKKSVR